MRKFKYGRQMIESLTIWRQIDLALAGEEVVALALRLKLGRKLLRRDLGERNVARLLDLLLVHVSFHLIFY